MKSIITKQKIEKKISISRIALLGMLLAFLITLKYALGFIPGIEVISFMFIFLGIILPLFDLSLLLISFNLSVLVIYGFGTWWIAYWVIFPIDAFVSKFLSKITKSKTVFAIWGFLAGLFVFFWYFLSDIIFFDFSFATLNIITAIPINLIEGLTTMIMIIVASPLMLKAIEHSYPNFYNKKLSFQYKNNSKYSNYVFLIIALISVVAIILLFIYNDWFFELKEHLFNKYFKHKGHL